MEDLELARACARGDNDAWETFLDRYDDFLRFIIRRSSTNGTREHELDDLHDEILAWLVQREGRVLLSYRGESKLTSWLGVVVGRQVRRLQKREMTREGGKVSLDALSVEAGTELADGSRLERGGFDPRAIDALREALKTLSDRDRTLLTGAFLEKRSYEELAEELGVKEASVGQLLFRAKGKLKQKLGGEKFFERLSGSLALLLSFLGGPL